MTATPETPVAARLAEAGLHRVSLSAANEMGRVNAWIVDDDPLTLVDAGTRGPGGVEALEQAFAALGRRLADVRLVLLTHQHTDHLGLVAEVVRRSGADVAALAPIAPYLADYAAEAARDRVFMAELLRRHGALEAEVAGNDAGWSRFHGAGEACQVTVPLAPGSQVTLRDRTFELLHRPGHSETDVLLVDVDRRLAIGGDHLLRATPSVPVADRPLPAGDGTRPYVALDDDLARTLRYRESLRATAPLPVDVVLPGHGGPFSGPAAIVAAHLAKHERDADALLERLAAGPATAMGVVRATWPQAPPGLAFVLLSSVLGGLGMLRETGRVAYDDDADAATGAARFVAV